MRIISKFHDYYDSIQKHYPDDPDVWLREQKELPLAGKFFDLRFDTPARGYDEQVEPFVLSFCGRGYLGFRCEYKDGYMGNSVVKYCYSGRQVVDFFAKSPWGDYSKALAGKEIRRYGNNFNLPTIERKIVAQAANNYHALHQQYNAPLLLVREVSRFNSQQAIIINPCLKQWEFQQVWEPYTAFQEIDRYLSTILARQQPEMVQIKDIDMVAKKGFDKWSFRKPPTKKK